MTRPGVDDYFSFLFNGNKGCALTIAAYFDESVRNDGKEPICVAGYLFKAADYKRFKQRWYREVLRLPGRKQLKHLHATDLCAGWGEYKGMTIPERVAILDKAVDVITATAYAAVGVMFNAKEFQAVAPAEWATYRGSIYSSACFVCTQSTGYWLSHDWDCHLDVLYVFERGYKFQDEVNNILNAVAANQDARKRFRYRNHLFEDKNNECGLQAADLLAWTCTKAGTSTGKVIPSLRPFAKSLIRLSRACSGRSKLYYWTGEKLRRFMVEQVQGPLTDAIPINFGPRKPGLK